MLRLVVILMMLGGCSSRGDSEEAVSSIVSEQIVVLATIVATIAALPALIEFLMERRKRKERISLSLDDVAVSTLKPRLAGMDDLLESIADLIDRARDPREYATDVGNEVLIVGPPLSGKQSLAQVIARRSEYERLITVYNPRNADALAKAKSMISSDRATKMMLLLPRIDQAFEKEDEDVLTELEALIESTADQANVLVVGTALEVRPNSPLDNLFGIKLVLPGGSASSHPPEPPPPEMRKILAAATRFYLADATGKGFALEGQTEEQFVARVLKVASNPAEVEDIVTLCQTAAVFARRTKREPGLRITPAMLDVAISRVVTVAPQGMD